MRTYKTEIVLNDNQINKYNCTIGTCRFIYNLFLQKNKELYNQNKDTDLPQYMNNYEFSKWLNNEFVPNNEEYKWIKNVSSKSIRHTIDNANRSFMKFFKQQSNFPKFKKKGKRECGMYFTRNGKNGVIKCQRHRIKIPTLGWCKIKEFGYIPVHNIISGTITKKANRYYVSVMVDEDIIISPHNHNEGIGIDLGIKDFAILNDGTKFKTLKQKKLYKKLTREQRKLSRKFKKKGESTKNLDKQKLKVEIIHHKITNTRNDYLNKVVNEIIKQEPSFITIEDLNVKGMMKNRHLARAIANQGFYEFKQKLIYKCILNNIELRQVNRFYPSSKTCSCCGCIKKDLKLKDRIFKCNDCDNIIDRDVNAAINLFKAFKYEVIA